MLVVLAKILGEKSNRTSTNQLVTQMRQTAIARTSCVLLNQRKSFLPIPTYLCETKTVQTLPTLYIVVTKSLPLYEQKTTMPIV